VRQRAAGICSTDRIGNRLLYLPAIALAGGLAAGPYAGLRRLGRPNLAPAPLGAITALFAARTLVRNADWQSDLTLASSAVRVKPNSFKTHGLMAEARFGADDSHANIGSVIEEADRSVAIIDPLSDVRSDAHAFRLAAGFYLVQGDLELRRGLNSDPAPPPAAQAGYRKALPLALRYASIAAKFGASGTKDDALELLAELYLRAGDAEKARSSRRRRRAAWRPSNPLFTG
jgi:hypothetical protein